jgi:hypothetical protein
MSTVSTKGKVRSYDIGTGRLVCKREPPTFIWRGNKVRTSGDHDSACKANTFIFDVTVSRTTAEKLVENFVFELEYDDSGSGTNKRVTKFAGEAIPPETAAFSADLASANPASNRSAAGLPAAGSPSSLPPAP